MVLLYLPQPRSIDCQMRSKGVKYSHEKFAREVAAWQGMTALAVLQRPQGGDDICRRLGPLVRALVARELSARSSLTSYSDDLCQIALLRVWRTFHCVPSLEVDRLWAWVRLVTKRQVVDALRHEQRRRRGWISCSRATSPSRGPVSTLGEPPELPSVDEDDPAWLALAVERREVIRMAVADLEPRQRSVLIRAVVIGEQRTEIAHALGISRWAVSRDLDSAFAALKARLDGLVEP